MSLIVNIAKHIAASTAWIMDVSLFVGGDILASPATCVVVREVPGSNENWSGLQERAIQIVCQGLDYVTTEDSAEAIFTLFKHKAGFSGVNLVGEGILYCDAMLRPTLMDRDERGSFIFAMSFVMRKS
uniref:Tail protein n=1 Tax=viral metagenome TaxID=1070528 RepID=A0A6M3LJQ0_9ZZZZ